MTKQDTGDFIYSIEREFLMIKSLSTCGAIDQLCEQGITKLVNLGTMLRVTSEIKKAQESRIDPMM